MVKRSTVPVLVVFFSAILVPTIFGWLSNTPQLSFTGLIANPLDSFSYLAKMRQGYEGAWLFVLPFSSAKSAPSFLFEYYIFLGHLSRWMHISLINMFHLARITNSGILAWSIWIFIDYFYEKPLSDKTKLWRILLLGSGVGWIAAFFQKSTADLWVAEAYPFLASYTNPHFPLSIALMLVLLVASKMRSTRMMFVVSAGSSLVLSIIQPFCVILIGLILGIQLVISAIQKRINKTLIYQLLAIGLFSLPFAWFYWSSISTDPLLQQWNSQNLTQSPVWWDVLAAFSPGIPVVSVGVFLRKWDIFKKHQELWIWLFVGFGCLLLPFQLQRRFLIGIYIPLTMLAWYILSELNSLISTIIVNRIKIGYQILIFPTTILIILLGIFGILQKSPYYFLNRLEVQAINWLQNNGSNESIVFTDPQTSLFIPGMANRRVVYGHPYETPNANTKQGYFDVCLQDFSSDPCKQILHEENVKYFVLNSLRVEIPATWTEPTLLQVYSNDRVKIYEVE